MGLYLRISLKKPFNFETLKDTVNLHIMLFILENPQTNLTQMLFFYLSQNMQNNNDFSLSALNISPPGSRRPSKHPNGDR